MAEDSSASATAKSEVTCAAGQLEADRNPEKAKQLLSEAIQIDPTFEDAYRYMGDVVAADPNAGPNEAEKWYARGMEKAPGGTLNTMQLARMLGTPEHYQSRRFASRSYASMRSV